MNVSDFFVNSKLLRCYYNQSRFSVNRSFFVSFLVSSKKKEKAPKEKRTLVKALYRLPY